MVKNLPKHITQERFKEHFSAKGEVTDAKLAKTGSGELRRFGFIGFKTAKEARAAIKYFNNTFIDTSKIEVVEAKAVGDPSLPRPWSRHTEGSTAHKQRQEAQKAATARREETEERLRKHREATLLEQEKKQKYVSALYAADQDPKLKEFLEVMRPRAAAKHRTWANDDLDVLDQVMKKNVGKGVKAEVMAVKNRKAGGEGMLVTRTHVRFGGDEGVGGEDGDEDYQDLPVEEVPVLEEKEVDEKVHDAKVSDLDYFKSRMKSTLDDDDDKVMEEKDDVEAPPASIIADTGRLFVKNLSYTCTRDDLEKLFGKYGPLSEIHISVDKETKKPRGYAFILYLLPEHAVKAYGALDNSIFQGRILEVVPGKERPPMHEEDDGENTSSYKRKKDAKRKAEANSDVGWNSLFLNSDAVAEAMALKLGVTKGEILDPGSDNMAVRLAVAETQIIAETKQYLEEEGIDLEAFSRDRLKTRSRHILLVKNLPAGTTEEDMNELFGKFGTLTRVAVPPTGTLAMVDFGEENEAKVAFRRLAYTKFKHLPLYLEWAPVGTFKEGFVRKEKEVEVEEVEEKKVEVKGRSEKKAIVVEATGVEEEDVEPAATLFVKNLNFTTTDEGLKEAFSDVPGVRTVRVSMKVDKKGKKLSMGFGFVEFESKEMAKDAMKVKQGVKIEGHEVQLKFSNANVRRGNNSGEGKGKRKEVDVEEARSSKLAVRNIPFEANKKEIRDLFSTFGQVKSVRLPKKFDGTHRGFCFVDFLTKQEALAAFKSLSSTHLYGRHLVLEWAEDETSVEAIRKRTAKAFFEEGTSEDAKRRRVVMEESVKTVTEDMDED
ncbi:hypothetical protein BC829DRAFT_426357 [Chytridium lagenaria]|nr:hypothetical protein BC829DRAFT_426357 [Chytridium lagenaria]